MVTDLIGEVDRTYLQKMKLRQHVPVAYCISDKNILDIASFVPAFLDLLEVMDEQMRRWRNS